MEVYKARYIFPVTAPPLRDGYLTVAHGRVVELGATCSARDVIDLGNVAILPGLINAHTHLELSDFDQPIGNPASGFPAWIREVVAWRRAQGESLTDEQRWQQRQMAVQRGLAESAVIGVTRIADIVSPGGESLVSLVPPGMQLLPFQETLGLATNRAAALYAQAEAYSREPHRGLSPHAPYTVGIELLEQLVKLSAERKIPLAMHLAESPDELELLRSHSGAFYALLNELGAWDPSAFPRGIRILDYLKVLAQAEHALIIHGNYLTDTELDYVAEHRDRLTVVYCPRTHAYFGHPRYPLPEMLRRGIRVALGTDSRASNADLNVWDELRYVADTFPELSLPTILSLATQNATHLFADRGELAIGQRAELIVVDLPEEEGADPYELLFAGGKVALLS